MRTTFTSAALCAAALCTAQTIRIGTAQTEIILKVNSDKRLYQTYLGEPLLRQTDAESLTWTAYSGSDGSLGRQRGREAYPASGGDDLYEPALAVTHHDGNQTTYLYYIGHETRPVAGGTETIIRLADDKYPLNVALHYVAFEQENVIKAWSEISHSEPKAITLWRYASAMLYLDATSYHLTNYHGDWAREAIPETQRLAYGKKTIDTKLGTRAAMQSQPFFELGLDAPARENEGSVLLGAVAWTGNFSCTFEVDNVNTLRLAPGINAYASNYILEPGQTFLTPEFIFTLSQGGGTANASRSLHDWARQYQLAQGRGDRMTLLNNWEATGFRFNQSDLERLIAQADTLGVDMFLLDDGWFGNDFPRNDSRAGLGDWQPNANKLPGGLKSLTQAADKAGVKFGLWIEPEMANPKSELLKKHPNWAITQPNRKPHYHRNQLVLDLANPEVQDFVFGVVDGILTEAPGIAYLKWDCNSIITNIHSPYLGPRQGNLYIDYVRGLYNVLRRLTEKRPDFPMMLCSGGGARCDYEALKHFTEFWCSDNTDPFERIYIQWSMSKFFPAKAMAAHVTEWNKAASLKFRIDVASMCRLGFDLDLAKLTASERELCRQAVENYQRMKPTILDGDQFRLVSPYETNHAALNYVSKDKRHAVVFAYDLHPRYREPLPNIRPQGLDPTLTYEATETNLPDAKTAKPQRLSGDYLMKIGLPLLGYKDGASRVVELRAVE